MTNATNNKHQHPHLIEEKDWSYGTEELLDALPQRWTRSILYFLVGFTAIALPWAMFSQVDETGSARGRLEPKSSTHRLDAVVGGKIINVAVKEGESVQEGQLLVEIDSQVLRTDLQKAHKKLEGLLNRINQLQLAKNQIILALQVQEQQNRAQELAKIAQINQANQNLYTKSSNYKLQKWEKLAQVEQAKQKIYSSQAEYQLARSNWRRDLMEIKRYHSLWEQGAIAQTKVVELQKLAAASQKLKLQAASKIKQAKLGFQEQKNRYQAMMSQAQSDIQQAKFTLGEQQNTYNSIVNSGKLALLRSQTQLKELQRQIATQKSAAIQTKSQIKALGIQLQQRLVRSPIDGTIFTFPITQPGVVVQSGQTIAKIAPQGSELILNAEMASQNSGFLRIGMPVKIKFDAYPFQDYGVIPGKVIWISPDSKTKEISQGQVETFQLKISLQHSYIQNHHKPILLSPGQTANAEVIIRQRRVIDFILDPFKKLQKGGLNL
ncbi:HlyD family efflux transporter periplasmic adaptor subunit [Calothrix rhizosoleniae]|uniref:HlyD family efflux transporter periplasmic adaptor subunit n=1 Tax=Calothrix rhizosoleniae TaxID=888997 RepID=UPI000B49BBB9|nr:HlyD family efflux transporter periplasmic adaptor subunit [Calothrix rhizosoleniae]